MTLNEADTHRKTAVDERTPEELLAIIEAKGREIAEALALPQMGPKATGRR